VLAGMAAPKYVNDRQCDYAQVEPDRPVLDVMEIIPDALLRVGVPAEIIDLRSAFNSCFNKGLLHAIGDFLLETVDNFRALRPWPDNRHLFLENVV